MSGEVGFANQVSYQEGLPGWQALSRLPEFVSPVWMTADSFRGCHESVRSWKETGVVSGCATAEEGAWLGGGPDSLGERARLPHVRGAGTL